MNFSIRLGLKTATIDLQITSMNDALRNGLWNCYRENIIDGLNSVYSGLSNSHEELDAYFAYLWYHYYKKPIDSRPNVDTCYKIIRTDFFKYLWNEVYDFIEFHTSEEFRNSHHIIWRQLQQFEYDCNKILEREFAGYRFIEHIIVPISNEIEVNEIKDAISKQSGTFTNKYKNIQLHLKHAVEKLSDKKSPDYRNSIKESISAVECVCREMTGEETLGKALKKFEEKGIKFNNQFKQGIEKLYVYTNEKGTGIRHALLDATDTPTFEEAKFMLVVCSAFINYIIASNK